MKERERLSFKMKAMARGEHAFIENEDLSLQGLFVSSVAAALVSAGAGSAFSYYHHHHHHKLPTQETKASSSSSADQKQIQNASVDTPTDQAKEEVEEKEAPHPANRLLLEPKKKHRIQQWVKEAAYSSENFKQHEENIKLKANIDASEIKLAENSRDMAEMEKRIAEKEAEIQHIQAQFSSIKSQVLDQVNKLEKSYDKLLEEQNRRYKEEEGVELALLSLNLTCLLQTEYRIILKGL